MWPADRPNPSYPKPSDLIQTMVRARKYLNVSQSDLADLRGVAASTQHQWETGADTRLSTVYGIAEALGVRLKISIETNQGMWFHVHPDLPNPMDASLSDQALSITEAIVELSDEKLPESTAKMIYALLLWSAAQHPDPVAEWTRQDIEMQYLADLPITPVTDYTGALGARRRVVTLVEDALMFSLRLMGMTQGLSPIPDEPRTPEADAILGDEDGPPEFWNFLTGRLNDDDLRLAAAALVRVPRDLHGDSHTGGPSLRMYLERTIFWTGAWAL
jgi:transcriptional regulator with XRE-family HTH domain